MVQTPVKRLDGTEKPTEISIQREIEGLKKIWENAHKVMETLDSFYFLRNRIWDTFWSGGISNPLPVIEQITYLLFAKRLDDIHTGKEAMANTLGQPIEAIIPLKRSSI